MKYITADLLDDVVSVYDQTKTTIQGRTQVNTISGDDAIGPPLNKFADVFTDAAITPSTVSYLTTNGRLFTIAAEAGGLAVMALYTLSLTTGALAYVGKIQIQLADTAATVHTYRSLKVIDTGTTGWKIFLTSTGSVAINGGSYIVNDIALADFIPVGFPTISFGTANNQKAVYLMQDPANIGVGQLQIASAGSVLDIASNRLYVHNGIAATHQYYVYNTAAALTYATNAVTGVAATDIISDAGHPYVDNDPITFTAITGGAGITVGTTYFVRSSVAGVSYQISTTTGGAALNFTTDISAGTVGRAFGTISSTFVHKTGNLPALTGTLLLIDSEYFAQPQHTTNAGFDCAFLATSTNLYLGRLSELTSGAVTWPSLVTSNLLGSANQIVAPTTVLAAWDNALDRAVYSTNTNLFVMKQIVNNSIDKIFGGADNTYLEGTIPDHVALQTITMTALSMRNGWLAIAGSATGQRGFIIADIRSDEQFDYSYIVTKVLDTPASVYKFITTLDKLFEYTGSLKIEYRTSGFGSISGGWASLPFAEDLSGYSPGDQVQFKIRFDTLALDTSIPAQLTEFILGFDTLTAISDNWEYSHDDSSSGNPSIVAFRLKEAYTSVVPQLFFRAFDLSNALVVNHNTIANTARFEYSTDGGVNWNALGVIPNTVGTLVRYTFSTPPGVDVRVSIKEE